MNRKQSWLRWHALRSFFESREAWAEAAPILGLSGEIDRAEYERLLYGTDADAYVPLWASACLTGEDILLNETTLELIRFYKKYGYVPAEMDGNPPDYAGQQCRFLEYLSVCALREPDAELDEAIRAFCDRFLVPCAYRILSCAEELAFGPAVLEVLRLLLDAACGRDSEVSDLARSELDSVSWRRGPELPVEPPRTVFHASFCDCGNKCRMLSTVQEGCVLSILPDKDFMGKSFAGCPRGIAYRQTFLSSRRLRYPMARTGERGEGRFRRVSWEEAETLVAGEIRRVRDTCGPGSRFVLPAAGVCALMRGDRLMKQLLSCDGGYLEFYNFYSASCAEHILPYVYGTVFCGSPEDQLEDSRFLLLWGHNPADTHFGDQHTEQLVRAKRAGARIVVIDPRCTDTAELFADQWIPIRPGTDAALADAMAWVIVDRGLQDQDFLDRFCLGFDEAHMPKGAPPEESYRCYLTGKKDGIPKTPAWAERITGVPAAVIEALAVEFASTKPACLLPGLGPQRTLCGEQTTRAMALLACLTGSVGLRGGGSGAVSYLKEGYRAGFGFAWKEDPYPVSIPSFLWTRAADRPESIGPAEGLLGAERLETGIRLLFSLASGILMNQHSNINDTVRILKDPEAVETVVVSDLFMTPGSRFADLLLPGVSFFETENIVSGWSSADYLLFNQQAVPPLFGGRFEYDWIAGVAQKLGLREAFSQSYDSKASWMAALYEAHRAANVPELPPYEAFRAQGGFVLPDRERRPAFEENIRDGVPFRTPSGKIELFSQRLYESGVLPGIPRYVPVEEGWEDAQGGKYPLQLIGYHSKRRCHSIGDGNRLLEALEPQRLWMHPADAGLRDIRDGDPVEVFNDRGVVRIPVLVTERIAAGVVALAEGAWYRPDRRGRDLRGSVNVLTMTHRTSPLAHANPQHTNLVEVRPVREADI